MTKFKGKYRIESTRLLGWDYAAAGYYFVTICTKNRELFFGEVVEGEMRLSEMGEIASGYWLEIPEHFPYAGLDKFVVMPNHVHGIVVIHEMDQNVGVETQRDGTPHNGTSHVVETPHVASLRRGRGRGGQNSPPKERKFGPLKPGSLSKIIQAYKAAVTRQLRPDGIGDFGWQARFHDHIIRDEESLHRIRQYIQDNPLKWEMDENNPSNWKKK